MDTLQYTRSQTMVPHHRVTNFFHRIFVRAETEVCESDVFTPIKFNTDIKQVMKTLTFVQFLRRSIVTWALSSYSSQNSNFKTHQHHYLHETAWCSNASLLEAVRLQNKSNESLPKRLHVDR